MEALAVSVLILISGIYLARRLYGNFGTKPKCACGEREKSECGHHIVDKNTKP